MTLQEVAEFLGISYQAVMNYESGRYMPSIVAILRMAELFDVKPGDICGWPQ